MTARGWKDATADEHQVRSHWPKDADANVGIATGSMSGGLVVIDIDATKGGFDALERLESELGPLAPTLTVRTGGGGLHLYYRFPGSLRCRGNFPYPGIDVRANGGYVVAPPSLHASGRQYAFATCSNVREHAIDVAIAPWDLDASDVSALPESLAALLQETQPARDGHANGTKEIATARSSTSKNGASIAPLDLDHPLPAKAALLLVRGDEQNEYPSRSEVVQAIVTGAVRQGHSRAFITGHLVDMMLDPTNVGGERVRDEYDRGGLEAAKAYVSRCYDNADALVAKGPSPARGEAASVVEALRERLPNTHFGSPSLRVTNRKHFLVHLQQAETYGLIYTLATRDQAEWAGSGTGTPSVVNARLVDLGLIEVVERGTVNAATTFRLSAHDMGSAHTSHTRDKGYEEKNVRTCACAAAVSLAPVPGHDVWRRSGGLSGGCCLTFQYLPARGDPGVTPETIRMSTQQGKRTVQRHLAKLSATGVELAVTDGHGNWWRGQGTFDDAASYLGTRGTAARQHERHEAHRRRCYATSGSDHNATDIAQGSHETSAPWDDSWALGTSLPIASCSCVPDRCPS